jgi:hypothetical protein
VDIAQRGTDRFDEHHRQQGRVSTASPAAQHVLVRLHLSRTPAVAMGVVEGLLACELFKHKCLSSSFCTHGRLLRHGRSLANEAGIIVSKLVSQHL